MVPSRTPTQRRRRWSYGKHALPGRILQVCLLSICVLWNLVALQVVVFAPSTKTNRQSRQSILGSTDKLIVQVLPPEPINTNHVDGRDRVVQILLDAGVTESFLQQHAADLPTWSDIVELYGEQPIVWTGSETGNDACAVFRERVPAVQRMLGAAGMFSTGTNLVTQLLKRNCYIPERVAQYGLQASKEQLGMRWQVPWGKHTPQHFRSQHAATHAQEISKDDVLPVITIRHPYRWMRSMCKNPYTTRWSHDHQCPNLLQTHNKDYDDWNPVTVKYGAATESYQSLAHLWNDWYNDYYYYRPTDHNNTASYPRIMIRMEDLIFHTQSTIRQVCHCAGGRLYSDNDDNNSPSTSQFQYITDSAKADSPGHDTSTGLAEAWIKYSRPLGPMAGMVANDYHAAVRALDSQLMLQFGYQHPPPTPQPPLAG